MKEITPTTVTITHLLALCEQVGGQRAAARLLRVDERTVRRWVAGDRECPWCAAELLRRLATEMKT
jgi:DNA-binding transcriptional regulator YdaS (Cro superfamily)